MEGERGGARNTSFGQEGQRKKKTLPYLTVAATNLSDLLPHTITHTFQSLPRLNKVRCTSPALGR